MTGQQVVDEVLLVVPRAQLHKVENNLQTLLVEGDFSVAITSQPQQQQQSMQAAVGEVAWPLDKQLPALKAADNIYSFALPSSRAVYYCLILPHDTPRGVLEALHDVLHASSALSTVKQVDAAAEEVDKLQGGREAAALAAAEAAGTAPDAAAAAAAAAAANTGAAAAPTAVKPGRAELPSSGNPTADKVAAGLLWGGTAVAAAVGRAASATAGAIEGYSQRQQAAAQQQQQAGQQPQATISPTFKRGLAVAAAIAASAAAVTGKLAELVGHASYVTALAIARALPGHKKKQPGDLVTPEERSALQTMGAAGLVAFVQVYDSLEGAAQVVFASSAQATTDYISYKYGPEAGAAAADSVPVARDMLTATLNCSRLGARAVVSKTAKKTAKVYLKSTMAGLHPDEQAAGSRLPALGGQAAAPGGSGGSLSAASAAAAMQLQQQQQMGRAGSAPAGLHSSSQALHSPYPQGSSAAAAAAAAAVGPARVGAAPSGSRLGQQ